MNGKNDVEIILVGNELLKGQRTDSHLRYISWALLEAGVRVDRAHTVGDTVDQIADVVRERLPRASVLIVTGGLGPTPDDITREGVARALDRQLQFDEPSWDAICEFFSRRGRTATDVNRRQAMFPVGSEVLENELGTAPGFTVDAGDTVLFVLPGPPIEVKRMFEKGVLPRIRRIFDREPVRLETFRTIGVGESKLRDLLGDRLDAVQSYEVSYLPSRISVDVVFTEKAGLADRTNLDGEADRFERELRDKVGNYFFERGERSLFQVVHDLLTLRGETIAVAESLTGGWISKQFTDLPGSSDYLLGDVVAYANDAKEKILGVNRETIEEFGAVSEETCTEMAHGIRHLLGADYGLATTGIAGPTGGTAKKPVGLTYIGISWDGGCLVKRQVYGGIRDDVRRAASHGVVWMLFDRLNR
ncbi:MAG: competence/damage-inducible protein A [Candidatus Latescibacterota bacterium]|jgi:nicotinamide-nucleotide amidase